MSDFLCRCTPYFNEEAKMPDGYYPLRSGEIWYVLLEGPVFMKRLKGKSGGDKPFNSLGEATKYAHKHKAAGLNFDQEVTA